jgi:hypothetical protein
MSITDYLINGLLVALVILQVRGRKITLRALLLPVGIVAWVAADYLHAIPTRGNDLLLVLVGAGAGLVLGAGAGITTRVFRRHGEPFAKATAIAAVLWVLGVGSRLAFELYTSHGGQGAIERFSVAHRITSANAWVDCLVLMALAEVVSRTAVIALRYWRVERAAAATPFASSPATAMMEARGQFS